MTIDYFSIFLLWAPILYGLTKSCPSLCYFTIIVALMFALFMDSGLLVESKIEFKSSSDSYLQVENKELTNEDSYNLQDILDKSPSKTHTIKINNVSNLNYSVVLKIIGEEDIEVVKVSL